MLELFPVSASIEDGVARRRRRSRDGARRPLRDAARRLLRGHRARACARDPRRGPGSANRLRVEGVPERRDPRLLAEEGVGVDVASLGELALARAAGIPGEEIVVHGNAKSDEELRAAADIGATVALDAEDEVERAAAAGVARVLVRVTLGVEADTHEAIQTGHHGSKFGLPPEAALAAITHARELGLDVAGLHVHVGSQLADTSAHEATIALLAAFAARCRDELGWTPALVNAGGGFAVRHVPEEPEARLGELARQVADAVFGRWEEQGLPRPELVLEPGRALVGEAGVTLYRVRSVKRLRDVTWVAVDGGMSDNPRPELYGARYTALSAARVDEPPTETVSVAGLHCESGDVLIDDVALPPPRRGDLVAVPATGAYALAMSSNYNATPRPAAVLVRDGEARVIRRRETIDDLLALESPDRG